eukprot:scaffold38343_cov26-Tisochrysis_lutea.AAC.2
MRNGKEARLCDEWRTSSHSPALKRASRCFPGACCLPARVSKLMPFCAHVGGRPLRGVWSHARKFRLRQGGVHIQKAQQGGTPRCGLFHHQLSISDSRYQPSKNAYATLPFVLTDKNRARGAEDAFKILSEAHRVISALRHPQSCFPL